MRAIERRSEDRIRALIEYSSDVVVVVGPDLLVRWQAASLGNLLGDDAPPLVGKPLTSIVHPDDAPAVERFLVAGLHLSGTATLDLRLSDARSGWRHIEAIVQNRIQDPNVNGLVLTMRDVTDRKRLEEELRHQAFHDTLTGLANRALFEDRLAHALAIAQRQRKPLALLFLDLDDFKTINDSLGHSAGDKLLKRVAERLVSVVRGTDTATRQGGDEFAVLLENLEGPDEARAVATRILDAFGPPFVVDGRELAVSVSIGLALSDGSLCAQDLMRNADVAMYAAKDAGKGRVRAFEQDMVRRAVDRLELGAELHAAIEGGQLELDYQPIIELESGRIVAVEALVRWRHPTRGRLAPSHFIALGEETGLIAPLGHWVLRTACRQAREFQQALAADPPVHIAVNVSARQLHDPAFPDGVAAVLEETGLAPSMLTLELTESVLVHRHDAIKTQLLRLKSLGVRLAIDDFGTGYSVLSYLQEFPFDLLKIEKSFVDDIYTRPEKANLVAGIINLASTLNLDVVAEGIEQHAQAELLRVMHARFGQGFLFSRPIDGEALLALLAESRGLTTPPRTGPAAPHARPAAA